MKSSIRTQITTAFIVILTLTMVLCIGLNNGLLKDFYYQKKQEKVVHYYEKLDQLTNNKSENDSKVSAVLINMRDADNISFIQTTSDWTLDEVSQIVCLICRRANFVIVLCSIFWYGTAWTRSQH